MQKMHQVQQSLLQGMGASGIDDGEKSHVYRSNQLLQECMEVSETEISSNWLQTCIRIPEGQAIHKGHMRVP